MQNLCELIIKNLNEYCTGKVLEIGPFHGAFSTCILNYTNDLTVIEPDPEASANLQQKFNDKVKIIQDNCIDFLYNTEESFDSVIIFGVLYHCHSPLMIIESLINNCQPTYVLVETWDSPNQVFIKDEFINVPGWWWTSKKTSKLSITLNDEIYTKAMENLGYKEVKKFKISDMVETHEGDFKHGGIYTVFEKIKE